MIFLGSSSVRKLIDAGGHSATLVQTCPPPPLPPHSEGPMKSPAPDETDLQAAERLTRVYRQMNEQLGRVIVGQNEVLKQVLIALFCQGHCILEGVPGLAKTLMISSIADLLSLTF